MSRTKRERRKVRRRLKALADKRAAEGSESQDISGVLIASRMIRIAGSCGPEFAARLMTGRIGVDGEQRLAALAEAELRIEMKSE